MDIEKRYALYQKAFKKWGKCSQINLAIEECGELIVALVKRFRFNNGSSIDDIIGELADVEIMIEQMKLIFSNGKFGVFTFEIIKKKKLEKLRKLLIE